MLKKNDPLIGSVLQAMQYGNIQRQVENNLCEEFGVHSRKALTREMQVEYDTILKQRLDEALKGGQAKIDVNKNKRIDSQDLAMLRAKKQPREYGVDTERSMAQKEQPKKAKYFEEEENQDREYGVDKERELAKKDAQDRRAWAQDQVNKGKEERKRLVKSLRAKTQKKMDEEQIDEISDNTLQSYKGKAEKSLKQAIDKKDDKSAHTVSKRLYGLSHPKLVRGKYQKESEEQIDEASYSAKAARAGKDIGKPGKMFSKISADAAKRYGSEERGRKVAGAVLAKIRAKHMEEESNIEEVAPPGAKYERMVKHIKDKYSTDGLTKKEQSIAYATAWKAKNKKKMNEGITLDSVLDEISANLGADVLQELDIASGTGADAYAGINAGLPFNRRTPVRPVPSTSAAERRPLAQSSIENQQKRQDVAASGAEEPVGGSALRPVRNAAFSQKVAANDVEEPVGGSALRPAITAKPTPAAAPKPDTSAPGGISQRDFSNIWKGTNVSQSDVQGMINRGSSTNTPSTPSSTPEPTSAKPSPSVADKPEPSNKFDYSFKNTPQGSG